jgi:hypothetical protein
MRFRQWGIWTKAVRIVALIREEARLVRVTRHVEGLGCTGLRVGYANTLFVGLSLAVCFSCGAKDKERD